MHDFLQQYYDDTLAWCNQQRAAFGKPSLEALPPGLPASGTCCPVACALDLPAAFTSVLNTWYAESLPEGVGGIAHPLAVRRFIESFDRGDYPHLVDA